MHYHDKSLKSNILKLHKDSCIKIVACKSWDNFLKLLVLKHLFSIFPLISIPNIQVNAVSLFTCAPWCFLWVQFSSTQTCCQEDLHSVQQPWLKTCLCPLLDDVLKPWKLELCLNSLIHFPVYIWQQNDRMKIFYTL